MTLNKRLISQGLYFSGQTSPAASRIFKRCRSDEIDGRRLKGL